MVVVESGIDPCVLHFVHEVGGAGEIVYRVSDEAIHGELQIWGAEIPLQNRRDRASDAAVRSGVLRMSGCARERYPIRIGHERGITTACADRGHGPPETKGKFSVPAADGGVGESGPQHGHQSSSIRSVEPLLGRQIPEGAAVLLAGMLSPEKANLRLLWGSNSTVHRTKGHHLVVIVNPLLTVE